MCDMFRLTSFDHSKLKTHAETSLSDARAHKCDGISHFSYVSLCSARALLNWEDPFAGLSCLVSEQLAIAPIALPGEATMLTFGQLASLRCRTRAKGFQEQITGRPQA
jgi:hypothetical protein